MYVQLFSLLREEVAAAGPGAYLLLIGHNVKSEGLQAMRAWHGQGNALCSSCAPSVTFCTAGLHPAWPCTLPYPHLGPLTPTRRHGGHSPPPSPPPTTTTHHPRAPARWPAEFDLPVLLRHAAGAALPTLRHARFLDTLLLANRLLPNTGGPGEPEDRKLPTLFEFFSGAPPREAHRALSDCWSNATVLHGLLDRLPGLPGGAAPRRGS